MSRPVWYAASSATARSPALSLDLDLKPLDFGAPSERVPSSLLQDWCGKYLGKVCIVYTLQMEFLPFEKIRCCGKLHNMMAAISGKNRCRGS